MREARDRVMHSFCMETYKKIENFFPQVNEENKIISIDKN